MKKKKIKRTMKEYEELSYRCEYEKIFEEIFLEERKKESKQLIYSILLSVIFSFILIIIFSSNLRIPLIYPSIASLIIFYYLSRMYNKLNSNKLDYIKEKRNKYIKRTTKHV